ncbi:GntR family transcriptional regulator [Marivita sp. GX14005]|uniref:GntR family transcriptional regulator n=1 Tax=Marivita sp. GX14005 TaxID=2942276 RepID=UPI002018B734|nr:GntR family transcriptional regulator [Marivita sp. GX14005]MCL3883159.1 GntR family transcriptional regulator [Marivita sp. GX14005]
MAHDEDHTPQGNAVYLRLMDELREGVLNPGDRLRETELAERLGVSRTPVREAIRQMEADGIVTHVPRQGASIRTLDYAEVMDLYEMRAVLEGTAARLAARAASDIEIAELIDMNHALAEKGSRPDAFALNRQFHAALLDAAKNRFLTRSITALQKALMILGPTTLTEPDRAERAVEEHRAVLSAIEARDGAAAEAAMRAHIEGAQRVRVRALRSRPSYDGDLL